MELCGIAHYTMRGHVVVDEQEDFDTWLAQQTTWAEIQSIPLGDPVAGKTAYATCAACHGQQGEGNVAMNAPGLAELPPWYIERQIEHFKDVIRDSYSDEATFMNVVVIERFFPDRSVRIHNFTITESTPEGALTTRLTDREELAAAIEHHVGIPADIVREAVEGIALEAGIYS